MNLMYNIEQTFVFRGKIKDYGVIPRTQMDSSIQNITLRTRDDMLIAHSTLPRM